MSARSSCFALRRSAPALFLLLGLLIPLAGARPGGAAPEPRSVYVFSSGNIEVNPQLVQVLTEVGFVPTLGVLPQAFDGSQADLTRFSAVLLPGSFNYHLGSMPAPGAAALTGYVQGGGGLVTTEWFLRAMREGDNGSLAALMPARALTHGGPSPITYTRSADDPVIHAGMPQSFTFAPFASAGTESQLQPVDAAAKVFYSSNGFPGGAGLVGWDAGAGRVASFSVKLAYTELADPNMKRLLRNTLHWVSRTSPPGPPTLTNCRVQPTALTPSGGPVTLSVDVSSSLPLSTVVAIVTRPDGKAVSLNLSRGAGSTYTSTFTAPVNGTRTPQVYRVRVAALDTAGTRAGMSCAPFTVAGDTRPPALLRCEAAPRLLPVQGGKVTVSADVTDDGRIASVAALVPRPGGGFTTVPMAPVGGNTFRGAFSLPANPGFTHQGYRLNLRATDAAGNVRQTGCATVTVAPRPDTEPPAISASCRVLPPVGSYDCQGGFFATSVMDNHGVRSVTLTIAGPDGERTVPLFRAVPGTAYRTFFFVPVNETSAPRTYRFTVTATDLAGNRASRQCGTFTVARKPA